MGVDIPEPFKWDSSFATFYDLIDDEHKQIFNAIFDCANDRGDAGKLKKLYDVTENHFKDEQEMMEKAKYANYDSHVKIHKEFLAKLKGLSCPLDDKSVHFAKDWLVNHIKSVDFNYKGQL